jgi:hypothetical protein
MTHVAWAKQFGKPVVLVAPSFHRTLPGEIPMPSLCQQGWYMEAAMSDPSIIAILWFMYGHATFAARGEEIFGAGETPSVLAYHRKLWDNVRLGGWGARLAVGDLDNDNRAEIAVGRGPGPGSSSGFQVFHADGTTALAPIEPFPGAHFGSSLAIGHLVR